MRPRRRLLSLAILATLAVWGCQQPRAEEAANSLRFLSAWPGLLPDLIHLLNRDMRGVQFSEVPIFGLEVPSALQDGSGDLGFVQADVVYQASRHGIEGRAYPHDAIRGMAVLWVNNFYLLVPRDSPAQSPADLRGKRIGMMQKGTAGEFMTRIILDAYGMSYDDVKPEFRLVSENRNALDRGELDAIVSVYPLVENWVGRLGREVPLRALPVGLDVIHVLNENYPFLARTTFQQTDADGRVSTVSSVGAEAVFVCRRDLGEPVVHDVTKSFFELLPEYAQMHAEGRLINPDLASATPIPLHPGAARYYREREVLRD